MKKKALLLGLSVGMAVFAAYSIAGDEKDYTKRHSADPKWKKVMRATGYLVRCAALGYAVGGTAELLLAPVIA